MASEVFSVKVSEELKDKIKVLIDESGMQGKDFMDEIIRLYEINTAKDIMPSAMGDIEELQAVTKRIYDIFVGLVERSGNLMKDREGTLKAEIEKKNRSITLIQEKLDSVTAELEAFRKENEDINGKYMELKEEVYQCDTRIQEQEKNHRDLLGSKEELIKEYREKNDALNGIISEYQEYKDKNKELVGNVDTLKVEKELLKKQVEEKERSEEKLKAEIEAIKTHNNVSILKGQMEKDKALLDLREKHQSKIEELNNEYNIRISEYNTKFKEFLNEFEGNRGSVSEEKKEAVKKSGKKV